MDSAAQRRQVLRVAPLVEWVVAGSGTVHAFEPGQAWSLCKVIDRPRGPAVANGRTCASCRSMVQEPDVLPDPDRWPEAWDAAGERFRAAMDMALDRLADALRTGEPGGIEAARASVLQVETAIYARRAR